MGRNESPRATEIAILNVDIEFTQGLELEPGRYELEVTGAGFEPAKEWLELGPGEEKHVKITLTGLKAHLWVEMSPPEATVTILNQPTEFTQGLELDPGRYEVEVSADGHETKREWVELLAGKEKHVSIVLTKLKSHLWVDTEPQDSRVKIYKWTNKLRYTSLPRAWNLNRVGMNWKSLRLDLNLPRSG